MSFYSFYGGKRGHSFVISKKYHSIEEMEADFALPDCEVDIGQYVMIDVSFDGETAVDNPDTGKLYQREINGPLYITDLSGPTGKTPIIDIGAVLSPEGEAGVYDTVDVTTTDHFNENTGDYIGSSLNFTIPVPTITLTEETGAEGSNVVITRVVEEGQTTEDTRFTPHYHIVIPRGWRGIGIVNAEIKQALDGSEQSHLVLDYVDPSYPAADGSVEPYSQDLGLIKTIEKIEIDNNANLNCYYSNDPETPVKLGIIKYLTEFNKEKDAEFGDDPSVWSSQESPTAAKVYVKYSDTGNTKYYLGRLNSIANIGKVTIPMTNDMDQNGQRLLIAMTDGTVKDLGDIRGAKGNPGPPIRIATYYTTVEDLLNHQNKDDIIGLKEDGSEDTYLFFYDKEKEEWVALGSLSADVGTKIIASNEQPQEWEQKTGDIWIITE